MVVVVVVAVVVVVVVVVVVIVLIVVVVILVVGAEKNVVVFVQGVLGLLDVEFVVVPYFVLAKSGYWLNRCWQRDPCSQVDSFCT